MKKKVFLFAVLFFALAHVRSQSDNISRIPLIGEKAPVFTAQSTKGTINFPDDFGSKWKILLSHPADFTPVCTSELMQLAIMQQEFSDINVGLAVISADELSLHQSWVKSMELMLSKEDKPIRVNFPMIDDSKLEISKQYGMLAPNVDNRKTVRGVFIIDPDNVIQAIFFYPKNVGKNMEEIKRTVIALQTAGENTVLTPCNWKPGEDVLLPYPYPPAVYDPEQAESNEVYKTSWYMMFKKLEK